jgi:hypothetical protein
MSRATPNKPLDAFIGRLLTPYCLGGRQGDNKQTYNEKYTYAMRWYFRVYCLMEEVQGFPKSH